MVIKFSQVARWWPPPTACPGGGVLPGCVRGMHCSTCFCAERWCCPACVSLPLSPGRLLASCAGVYAVLRALLYCFGRSGAPSVPATLEVAGVQLPVQAFHDTGFALQEPLSGKAVVLVQYPAVRHRLPQAARQYLDGWFAHSTAPPPPELGVHLVPCRSIHGQSMLPALPAALQLGKDRAGGLLAAFCCPTPPDPAWELLYGEDAAQLLL